MNAQVAPTITNIAAYKFAQLTHLRELREDLIAKCKAWELKGTILLSPEGINLFVAGQAEKIELLLAELRAIPGMEDLSAKVSESDHQPFSRMLVRLKREIIAFGVEGINPAQRTSPKLSPLELKQWLDEGRPVTLLDTRNDYEVKLGTFKGALPAGVDHFRDFPEAVKRLPEELKDQPIVMFCTGGIRCEKAGPFMEREGFRQIFQLDGGILKYFEDCGGAHYDGECFVFDQRVGVDPNLSETESLQCYNCLVPLTAEDQRDARYVPARSCPYCYKSTQEAMAERIVLRHEAIRQATTPLPGSVPYDNFRPISVPAEFEGATLIDFLCGILGHVPREEWLRLCGEGRLRNASRQAVPATTLVHAGDRYLHFQPEIVEPDVSNDIRILHEDEALIVVHKPAPLPLHPSGRFNRNTLQYILHEVYHPQKPRAAHRLDANTTGLVLVARTRHFASQLQPQFEKGEVRKTYLVRVQGNPLEKDFSCDAPITAEPQNAGARIIDKAEGLPSRTEFSVLRYYPDGTTLLEARPITGRTNQIRVHLWHLGFPVCGDALYLPGQVLGTKQTLTLSDPPLCLHACRLEFRHPVTGERVAFEAPAPEWSEQTIQ